MMYWQGNVLLDGKIRNISVKIYNNMVKCIRAPSLVELGIHLLYIWHKNTIKCITDGSLVKVGIRLHYICHFMVICIMLKSIINTLLIYSTDNKACVCYTYVRYHVIIIIFITWLLHIDSSRKYVLDLCDGFKGTWIVCHMNQHMVVCKCHKVSNSRICVC